MKLHILATARRPELLRYTTLVFDTLRVGFPSAEIFVQGNALPEFALQSVKDGCKLVDASFENKPETIHHEWIEKLIESNSESFWICDTDQIMYDSIEAFCFQGSMLSGRRIPEFIDEFSGCRTRSRLHTSLLYFNPDLIKERITKFNSTVADTKFTPIANLIYPIVVPFKGRGIFYDTCSQLYHAIGGQPFSESILERYFHFNFGTISDLVIPRLNGGGALMQQARDYIMENPTRGKGAWRYQEQHYLARQT